MNFGCGPRASSRSSVSSSSVDAHAVVVDLDLHDVGLVGAEARAPRPGRSAPRRSRRRPGSISVLQTRSITCWPPVVTSRSSGSTSMPSAAITSTMQCLDARRGPRSARTGAPRRSDSTATRAISAAKSSAGNVLVSGRPPASEMTSGCAVTAIRSRIAEDFIALRALGEQPGVALEVACVDRGAPIRRAFAAAARAPWRLVYRHAPRAPDTLARTMDFVFDLLQGAGIAAAIGIRPFLPALLVGALAAGDLGIDFDGTDFAFLEQARFLLASCWSSCSPDLRRPPAPGRTRSSAGRWACAARRASRRARRADGGGLARRPRPRAWSPA